MRLKAVLSSEDEDGRLFELTKLTSFVDDELLYHQLSKEHARATFYHVIIDNVLTTIYKYIDDDLYREVVILPFGAWEQTKQALYDVDQKCIWEQMQLRNSNDPKLAWLRIGAPTGKGGSMRFDFRLATPEECEQVERQASSEGFIDLRKLWSLD